MLSASPNKDSASSSAPAKPNTSAADAAANALLAASGASEASASETVASVAFNAKKWVWVPDQEEGYLAASIVSEDPARDIVEIELVRDSSKREISINDIQRMNPPKYDRVFDMTTMAYLNEASVVNNIKMRYLSDMIYTYSGLFLVAVNPFRNYPLYTDEIVRSYRNKRRAEMPPHIFAVADAAYRAMIENNENQSLLITGESGAGKTESTKKVIQYLTSIAASSSSSSSSTAGAGKPTSSSARTQSRLETQILQANPILESFANAQTTRNNNSSRFGKFIRIEFNTSGVISGATIDKYLLEKSRVTHRSPAERNYHIFYQLLCGASEEIKKKLFLDSAAFEDFRYLRGSNHTISGVDDAKDFADLQKSMDIIGLSEEDQFALFTVIALVLLLGNIQCNADRSNQASLADTTLAEKICHLAGIPVQDFIKGLLSPKIRAGRDWVTQNRTAEQVMASVEALARATYERMFTKLVERINGALDKTVNRHTFIGVLDIAGFEIFEKNSFEQLCINFTNEYLQQFFNTHMFKNEQEEYRRENIEWDMIDFGLDLQPTIDLIEKANPVGILPCLDEDCVMPKASDKSFTEKLVGLWDKKSDKFRTQRFLDGFVIKHYAGEVPYTTDGWLEKNKDPLNDNVARLLAASTNKYVAQLFSDFAGNPDADEKSSRPVSGMPSSIVKKGAFRTVAQKHKEQLHMLMKMLRSTQPHFIRCIVPNNEKKPRTMETNLVIDQLRCNGVLEGIRICRAGFPSRMPFARFRQHFELMSPGAIPSGFIDGHSASTTLLEKMGIDKSQYRIGVSKVFFRAGVLQSLEESRDKRVAQLVTVLQSHCRGFLCRQQHQRKIAQLRAVRVLQRNARVYVGMQQWAWWQLYLKLKPLLQVGRVDEELRKKEASINELTAQLEQERNERSKLEVSRTHAETERKSLQSALEKEQQSATDRENLLNDARARISTLQEELNDYSLQYAEVTKVLETTQTARNEATSKASKLEESLEETKTLLETSERVAKNKDEQVKRLDSELETLKTTIASLESERGHLQTLVSQLETQSTELSANGAESSRQLRKLLADIEELTERVETQQREIEELKRAKKALESEVHALQTTVQDLERAKSELEQNLRRREQEITTANSTIEANTAKIETLERARRELTEKLSQLSGDLELETDKKNRALERAKRLQTEFEELRTEMESKTDQETKNTEYRRVVDSEISHLRGDLAALQSEYEDAKAKYAATISAARSETDQRVSEIEELSRAKTALTRRISELEETLESAETSAAGVDKRRRDLENTARELSERQSELEDKVTQLSTAKETLERQLSQASTKLRKEGEDLDRLRRENQTLANKVSTLDEAVEDLQTRLGNSETARKRVVQDANDYQARLDAFEATSDDLRRKLAAKASEFAALTEKYNTDATQRGAEQAEAIKKLEREVNDLSSRITESQDRERNLERAKQRLTSEIEDLRVELETERTALREANKTNKHLESEFHLITAALESERRQRDATESKCRSLQTTLDSQRNDLEEQESLMRSLQQSKGNLENELNSLIREIGDGGRNMHELEKTRRRLEEEVARGREAHEELEEQLKKADENRRRAEETVAELRSKLERDALERDQKFEETKQLYMREVNRLGGELEDANQARAELVKHRKKLEAELEATTSREDSSSKSKSDLEKAKRKLEAQLREAQAAAEEMEREKRNYVELVQRQERRIAGMTQEYETLNDSYESVERERKKQAALVAQLEEELNGGEGGSKAQLLDTKRKLEKENADLKEQLESEQELRAMAEAKLCREAAGGETLRTTVQKDYEEKLEKLEEECRSSTSALRVAQEENESRLRELETLEKRRRAALQETEQLRAQLEEETASKAEEASQKRKIASENKDLQNQIGLLEARIESLTELIAGYKARADQSMARAQSLEVELLQSKSAETSMRISVKDLEESSSELAKEKQELETRLHTIETQLAQLREREQDDAEQLSEAILARNKLQTELNEERERAQRQAEEHAQETDAAKRRLQMQIKELVSEIEIERKNATKYREEVHSLSDELNEAATSVEEAQRKCTALAKEKERTEARITTLQTQLTAANAANEENQTQTVRLNGQLRDLRRQIQELEQQKSDLEAASRGHVSRLDDLNEQLASTEATRNTAVARASAMEKELHELRISNAEIEDTMESTKERLTRMDMTLQQANAELIRQREATENAERLKNGLDKQLKEMMVRVMELESTAQGDSGRSSARLQARVQELTERVDKETQARQEAVRTSRTHERTIADLRMRVEDSDRARQRFEESATSLETKLKTLRAKVDELETQAASTMLQKRRLERELQDATEQLARKDSEGGRRFSRRDI